MLRDLYKVTHNVEIKQKNNFLFIFKSFQDLDLWIISTSSSFTNHFGFHPRLSYHTGWPMTFHSGSQTNHLLHELVLPLPAMPSALFAHRPPLSSSPWLRSPRRPTLPDPPSSHVLFFHVSLFAPPIGVCASWGSTPFMMCPLMGPTSSAPFCFFNKTLNYTIQNWIRVQNSGKQWNDGKIVPENSLLWYKKKKRA